MQNNNEQNLYLLEDLRNVAETGLIIVHDAIFQAPSENVQISETFVKLDELESLENLLSDVIEAETIEELLKLLNEDSLPIELVIIDPFWGDFQELIYKLSNTQKEFER